MRVTVEPAAAQIKALLGQPVLQTDDLTVLKTGRPGNFAGIATVNKFRMRGNNMLNSQQLGYGIGHKTVGRRDNQQGITEALVMSDQVAAFLRNQRYYPFLQKGLAGVEHLLQRILGERAQGKFQILMNIERAGLILLVKMVIAVLVYLRIDQALIDQKLTKSVVAVTIEQGVIKIKNCQCHGIKPFRRVIKLVAILRATEHTFPIIMAPQ